MTALFTSSYTRWSGGMGTPVVASLMLPRWISAAKDWPRCREISPRWSYFTKKADRTEATAEQFAKHYLAQLDRYGPERIAAALEAIAQEHGTDRLVLLCYEAQPGDCHCGLFASWLLERTGELATEITP